MCSSHGNDSNVAAQMQVLYVENLTTVNRMERELVLMKVRVYAVRLCAECNHRLQTSHGESARAGCKAMLWELYGSRCGRHPVPRGQRSRSWLAFSAPAFWMRQVSRCVVPSFVTVTRLLVVARQLCCHKDDMAHGLFNYMQMGS